MQRCQAGLCHHVKAAKRLRRTLRLMASAFAACCSRTETIDGCAQAASNQHKCTFKSQKSCIVGAHLSKVLRDHSHIVQYSQNTNLKQQNTIRNSNNSTCYCNLLSTFHQFHATPHPDISQRGCMLHGAAKGTLDLDSYCYGIQAVQVRLSGYF